MDFLTDNEIEFDLPALKATAPASRRRWLPPSGRSSRSGTWPPSSIGWRTIAIKPGDHRGHQFLQWFIEEQVEEEAKVQSIVDLIESGINLFQAEALLDRFE